VQGSIGVVPGTDPVLEFLKEDPDAVKEALDVIASDLVNFLPRVIGAGLSDGIYLSVTNPNRQIPAETYTTYIAPSEKKILAAAKQLTPDHILHICGYQENRNILSVYPEYDVSVINWAVHAEQFGLKEGKELFGGRAVIGGFDQTKASVLYKGSKEEIEAYVEKLIDEVGTTGVIIGADCTVPADIDVAHLQWARDKAAELSR
jgi:uroporphyrinogen decarboxylase